MSSTPTVSAGQNAITAKDWLACWPSCASRTAGYVMSLRGPGEFLFRASAAADQPTAIGSATAALLLGFLGRDDGFDAGQRCAWADHIQGFQGDDGLFHDEVDFAEPLQDQPPWALAAHRTRHCIWAVEQLSGRPVRRPIRFIELLLDRSALVDRLEQIWEEPIDGAAWRWGNWIMDLGVLLDVQHRHFDDPRGAASVHALLDWLDGRIDPGTGFWNVPGTGDDHRRAMAGAMHLYPLYWAYGRPVPHYERAVEATLRLQQPDGLFAYEVGIGGSQCLDYDAMLVLVNGFVLLPGLRSPIRDASSRVLTAIGVNRNADGSWSDCRLDEWRNWGTVATRYKADEGGVWDAYARLMTVVMCLRILAGCLPDGVRSERHLFEVFEAGRGWRDGVGHDGSVAPRPEA